MKLRLLLVALLALALPPLAAEAQSANAGAIHVLVEQTDGTYAEVLVTPSAGQALGFDATGKPTVVAIPVVPAIPQVRAGSVAMTTATGKTKAITFATPFSAAVGTNYAITFNPSGLATNAWATAKTATGYTLNLPAAITGPVEYVATPLQ